MQTTLSIYATRDELRNWLAYQAKRFELHFALVRYSPMFAIVPLAGWSAFDQHKDAEAWREVWIDLLPVRHEGMSQAECMCQNHDRLVLQLPELRPEGLREGSIGTLSDDELHLRVWRAIIRYFRKQTTAGVWVLNPASGARAFYKTLRYSARIAQLHREGLPLLPFAGSNRVSIAEPDVEHTKQKSR